MPIGWIGKKRARSQVLARLGGKGGSEKQASRCGGTGLTQYCINLPPTRGSHAAANSKSPPVIKASVPVC